MLNTNVKNLLTGAVVSFLAAVTVVAMSFGAIPAGAQTVNVQNNDAAQTPASENNDDKNGLFSGDNNLEDLVILELLFNNRTNVGVSGNNLADLVILSELFNEDDDGLFGGDSDNLVDLIILEQLFADGAMTTTTTGSTTDTVTETVSVSTYTVRAGDTLFGIAQRFLGDGSRWTEIADMNGVSDPTELQIGTVLDLPSDATTTRTRTVTVPGTTSTTTSGASSSNLTDLIILSELFDDNGDNGDGLFGGNSDLGDLIILESLFNDGVALGTGQTYVVRAGDTLSGIAASFYGDASQWPRIADANNISNPRTLQIGQRLTIPSTASGVVGGSNLTDLVILSELFDDNGDGNDNLTDLIILQEVFGTGTTGITGTNNLYDLIILDELFSNN